MLSRFSRIASSGVAAMILAMVLLPFADALSKLLVQTYPAEQITWARNLFHTAMLLPIFVWRGGSQSLKSLIQRDQIIRGLAFVFMTACYVASLFWLPLADALAIVFLFPMLVTILAGLWLGEHIGVARWLAVIAGFAGAMLVIQPGFQSWTPGIPLAFTAAILTAIYVIMTRQMSAHASRLTLLMAPALIGMLALTPTLPFRWVTPDLTGWIVMIAIAGFGAAAHLLIITAYARAEASTIAPLGYTQIIMATLLGYLLFADMPDAMTFVGMAIIFVSGLFVSQRSG